MSYLDAKLDGPAGCRAVLQDTLHIYPLRIRKDMKLSSLAIAVISVSLTACNGHLRGNPRHIRKELFLPGSQPSIAIAPPLPKDYQRQRRRLQEMASLEEDTSSSKDTTSDDKTRLPPPEYFRPDLIVGWSMMQPSKKEEQMPGK